MTRSIPQIAVDFVASHEGMRLSAYLDSAGIATIGFGHIDGVRMGQKISKAEALNMLPRRHADRGSQALRRAQARRDREPDRASVGGLLSFAYNVGAKATWGLWKHINAGRLDLVPGELMKFTKAGGRQIPGLVHRRADEVKLWSTPEPHEAVIEAPPSSVTRQPGMTPPVNDVKPLAKQNTFVAQTLTGVSIAGAAASQYSAPIKSAADQLAAFTGAPVIEHISTILITVAGLCAMAGIVSAVLKHRAERQ
jgi:lysozyme